MPNITINASATDVAAQRSTPVGNQKKKNKRFRKKMRLLQQKGYLEGKHKHNHCTGQSGHDQTLGDLREWLTRPRPPTSTQNNSSPPPGSSSHCSSKPSSSTHSQPSLTLTVNNKGSDEKPKESVNTKTAATTPGPSGSSSHKPTATSSPVPTKYLAIDCEMVGTGPKGSISHLARCSIVSYYGDVIYDKFINPPVPVTDYRTRWSGIRRSDLARAMPFSEARKEILKLLMGKVVIGHAIHNDFKVLSYSHPSALTRDTSRIPLLNQKAGFAEHECASLKRLTKAIFNRDIQTGRKGHSSVEDARATMELYKVVEVEWERRLATKSQTS